MKKLKSILLLCLTVLFTAAPCLAGCGQNEAITISVKVPRATMMNSVSHPDVKDAKSFLSLAGEAFAAQYGEQVTVNIVEFALGQETVAIANTFHTEDAADILYDNFFNMFSFIHTGNAVPLDDLLTDELKADLNKKYVSGGTLDETLYMMPFSSTQNILIYNKQLLKACGLDRFIAAQQSIQNWTIDEWTEILNTLAEKLPEGSYPMMMYAANNEGDTHIMSYLRAFGSEIFDEEENFNLQTEQTVHALTWMQNGVNNGWYLPRPQNRTMTQCGDMFEDGKLAFYHFNSGSSLYTEASAQGGTEKYGFVNYPGNIATFFCSGFEVFDNGDEHKVNIAKDFVRFVFEQKEWLEYSAGHIPVSTSVAQRYKEDIFLLKEFFENSVNEIHFSHNNPNWQGSDNSVRSIFYQEIAKLFEKNVDGTFAVTPLKCAEELNKVLNEAIAYGREHSTPHA